MLSSGNMAQAIGYMANLFSIPSRVVIFDTAPMSKINACRRYGSEIDLVRFSDKTFANADALAHGFCFIHVLKEYGLMDGHGTIVLEILEDAPDVDNIFVPLRAGFLACDISLAAKAVKPSMRVVGVNAENCQHFYDSLRRGEPAPSNYRPTLADGIAADFTPSRGGF
jgi:threonine dehydratase